MKMSPNSADKIKSICAAARIAAAAQRRGKTVVTTNGCFDIIHVGHIKNLEHAKSLGDILIVGVNADASVRKNKGPRRPIVPARERVKVVAALGAVDYVFIFKEKTPISWLRKIKPNIHTKGADRKLSQIIEKDALRKIGAKLILVPHYKGKSTTAIIQKIGNDRG